MPTNKLGMLPSAEAGGDPPDELPMMMMMLVVLYEMMIMVTNDTLLSPLKIILSSRDLFPLFEISFCKETPQIAFLSEHVAILGYLCLASTLPYSPLFCWLLIVAEHETDVDGFYTYIDE